MQGACGYGYIKKNQWPYWSVGALTPGNQFAKAGPAHACGYAHLFLSVHSLASNAHLCLRGSSLWIGIGFETVCMSVGEDLRISSSAAAVGLFKKCTLR